MEDATVVVEVKYGDILRLFSAKVVDVGLDLSMRLLTEKIFSLLNFAPNTEIMLTYTDKDGDSVALVDDDDLRNVVKESLNPLKITVKLNAGKIGTPVALSNGSSTTGTWRSPQVKLLFDFPDAEVSEMMKTVPEPSRETFEKLWTESKDSDWSQVETVVKVIPSIQKIKRSDEAPAASSNSTKKRPRWVYIVPGIRKKLVQRNRYGNVKFEFEDEAGVELGSWFSACNNIL